jgi:hypothetical protein
VEGSWSKVIFRRIRLNWQKLMPNNIPFTPSDVAEWIFAQLESEGELYQETAASEIERRFGQEFTPSNENGNPSIRRDVLAAFRKLSDETVVWERGERRWRKREKYDQPGRQQD